MPYRRKDMTVLPINDKAAKDPFSLVALVNKNLRFLMVNHGSNATVSRYYILKQFIKWCYEREITLVKDISRQTLEKYLVYLSEYRSARTGTHLEKTTCYGYMHQLFSFFHWLTKNNYLLENPAGAIKLPRRPKTLPRNLLTIEEIEVIINQPDVTQAKGIRDRAILELFYSSGIRRQELLQLKIDDLDLSNGILMVVEGKGKKDRYVPITQRALLWLQKYLLEVRPDLVASQKENAVFITQYGKPFVVNSLTYLARSYINQACITKKGACHIFRHCMASLMLSNGADVRYIQEILGHSRVSSTQIYTQVSIDKLKLVHAKTHPANDPTPEEPNHGC